MQWGKSFRARLIESHSGTGEESFGIVFEEKIRRFYERIRF